MIGPGRTRRGTEPPLLPSSGWTAPLVAFAAGTMAFLAVLALAASLAAGALSSQWRSDLAGVATVRLSAQADGAAERLEAVLEVLRTTPGIAGVRVLDDEEQRALVAPWLGTDADLPDLPMPQLIDVTLVDDGPDAAALQGRLDLTVSGATYDDHAAWRGPLARAADVLENIAIFGALVVFVTVAALVSFAARSTLIANRRVVETLRLVGAEDRFIGRAFVGRLVLRGAVGALSGALLGCLAILLVPSVEAEDPSLSLALSPGPLGWFLLAVAVPAFCALVTWFAARAAVAVTLKRMP